MYEIDIQSKTENYAVTIGQKIDSLLSGFDAIVADVYFKSKLSAKIPIFWIESRESNKNLAQVENICAFFKEAGLTRGSSVLAIGGGIIQDLATMSASIYMRGIRWSYAPTTLTGMMDSCLGGKSSINVGSTKNLVGNIFPPEKIFIDSEFVSTLDNQAVVSGLAEGVKIAFARGAGYFNDFVENKAAQNPDNSDALKELIFLSLSAKKWFIEIDEFDRAERQLLNFGHSFGHAFEAACGFRVQHGVSVAIGMLAAIEHPKSASTIETTKLHKYCSELILPQKQHIKSSIEGFQWDIFKDSLRSDKKNTRENLVLILPSSDEGLVRFEIPFKGGAIEEASEALENVLTYQLAGDTEHA